MPIKVVPLGVWGLCSVHWWALQWDPSLIWVIPFLGQGPAFTLQNPAELGLIMVLLALAAWCHWGWSYGGRYHGLGSVWGLSLTSRKGPGDGQGDIRGWESCPQWLPSGRIWLCLLQAQHHISHPIVPLPAGCRSIPLPSFQHPAARKGMFILAVMPSLG